jgi:outer membrane protein assembly factor BamB
MSKLQNVFRLLMISTLLINLSTAEEAPKKLDRLINLLNKQVQQKLIGAESAFDTGISRTSEAQKTAEPEMAMFQNNPARTGVSKESGPEQLNELLWVFKTPGGGGLSFPVIYDGVIYVGSRDHHLYAIDSKTGLEKWKFKAENTVYSPVIVNGIAYVDSSDNHLYAINCANGIEKWRFKTNSEISGIPLVQHNIVYFSCEDHYLYAVEITTGKEKWKFKAGDRINLSSAIYDNIIYFGCADHKLYAVNLTTGQEKWIFKASGTIGPTAVYNGIVYFGDTNGFFYAVDTRTIQEKWKLALGYDRAIHPPAITDDTVYFGASHQLYAVDRETGKERWKFRTPQLIKSAVNISSNNIVHFGCEDMYIYALDRHTGKEKWKFKTNGEKPRGPVFAENKAFFSGAEGYLYAIR